MTVRAERPANAGPVYQPELDGVRAIAILMVMFYHLWDYRGENPIGSVATVVARQGWAGVDVFFALSGFLITRILRATRRSSNYYASFYVRRSLRIFPLYYAVLALLTAVGAIAAARGITFGELSQDQFGRIWVNYLYLSNFALALLGSNAIPLDISWSLAVEEQFYLVYPFVVRRLERPALERALLAAAVIAIPLRLLSFLYIPGNHYGPYALPFCRMDALAIGGLAALLLERQDRRAARLFGSAALPLCVAAVAVVFTWHRGQTPFVVIGYAVPATATAAVITRLELGDWAALRTLLSRPLLVAVGKVSYGLYLLHLFVRAAVDWLPWLRDPARTDLALALLRTSVAVAASFGIAWCSWLLFESPVLRLKARFDPKHRSSVRGEPLAALSAPAGSAPDRSP